MLQCNRKNNKWLANWFRWLHYIIVCGHCRTHINFCNMFVRNVARDVAKTNYVKAISSYILCILMYKYPLFFLSLDVCRFWRLCEGQRRAEQKFIHKEEISIGEQYEESQREEWREKPEIHQWMRIKTNPARIHRSQTDVCGLRSRTLILKAKFSLCPALSLFIREAYRLSLSIPKFLSIFLFRRLRFNPLFTCVYYIKSESHYMANDLHIISI